jgi:hypothetical protein
VFFSVHLQSELNLTSSSAEMLINEKNTFALNYCDVLPVNTSNNSWVEDFVSRFIGSTSGDVYNHL